MKVIIQCAASKAPDAGFLTTRTGLPVKFVAHPNQAPRGEQWHYAHPDDPSDVPGQSWRQQLVSYNTVGHNDAFKLLEAYRLYRNPVYAGLVAAYGVDDVFILSAGWGLVRADYFLPNYDITFAKLKPEKRYKHRRPDDIYNDFCHIQGDTTGPIVSFCSKDYLPLFRELTDPLPLAKVVFYAAADRPEHRGWQVKYFETKNFRKWPYDCAGEFLNGNISI